MKIVTSILASTLLCVALLCPGCQQPDPNRPSAPAAAARGLADLLFPGTGPLVQWAVDAALLAAGVGGAHAYHRRKAKKKAAEAARKAD